MSKEAKESKQFLSMRDSGYIPPVTLKEYERHFKEVLAFSRDILYRIDLRKGHFDFISESLRPITGYDPREFMMNGVTRWRSRIHRDDLSSFMEASRQKLSIGKGKRQEIQFKYRFLTKKGGWLWFSDNCTVLPDSEGKAAILLGCIRDITEQKAEEDNLRDMRNRLQAIMNTVEEHINIMAPDGSVLWHNQGTRGPSSGALGRKCWEVFEGRQDRCPHCVHPDILRDGRARDYETQTKEGEGRFRDWWVKAAPMRDDSGKIYAILETAVDITARKQTERAIRRMNEELEQRVLDRTMALQTANEELRTEMGERRRLEQKILEISEWEQRRLGQDLHDGLGQQLTGLSLMAKLLQQTLESQARPEAADAAVLMEMLKEAISTARELAKSLYPVELERASLGAALADLAYKIERSFHVLCKADCKIEHAIEKTVAIHLYRIAQEAMSNAIKHGKAKNIFLQWGVVGGRAVLRVENDGEPFREGQQVNQGMGLAIMRYRARMIRADLTILPGPKGGSIVTCSLHPAPSLGK